MAKKPYKYRQAKKDAKTAAKKAFPGKVKAVRKDITGKITAEDRLALKDMADTAKKELGKKAYLSKAEYNATRNAELDKFRQSMADEFGEYGGKKAGEEDKPAKKAKAKKAAVKKPAAALEKKAPVKKAAAKKSAVKKPKPSIGGTAGTVAKPKPGLAEQIKKDVAKVNANKPAATKGMTRAEKSAANKAAWAKMTPEERKNWKGTKPGSAEAKPAAKAEPKTTAKTTAPKRPTLADLKKNEAKGLEEAKKRVEAKKAAASKPRTKITVDGKTSAPSKPTAGAQALDKMKAEANAKAKAKAAKPKFRKIKAAGKGGVVGAVAGELVSLAKGSTKKDFDEINRLEQKLADITGKGKSKATAGRQGGQQQLSQLASLASLGVVGKTRRQRMDELNALIAKAEKKNKPKELRYGKDGSSLVPGTAAYKAGSKTRPTVASTGGGSTTKVDSRYTVKKGDTLSGIAKNAGLSLSEIRAANPEIMKKKKYKQGSMIWSGTKVNIPKK
jgi:colicin import membrane protein